MHSQVKFVKGRKYEKVQRVHSRLKKFISFYL